MANKVDSLIKIRDGLIQQLDGVNELIESMAPFVDMSKITWVKTEGPQGIYEKSIDVQNSEYQKLQDDLVQHNGKLSLEHYFVWLFSDGKAIGRKKR